MEYSHKELQDELALLPRGSISHKTINGKERTYLQWRDEEGKTRSRYLKQSEVPEYETKIKRRRELEKQLKEQERAGTAGSRPHTEFFTGVLIGRALGFAAEPVKKFRTRDCFGRLADYLQNDQRGRICILYGLRRTGKTTMLFQAINRLPLAETAYIKIKTSDNMSSLTKDLETLYNNKFKYVFIDEITLLEDFIDTAAVLSDIFSMMGMKIVVSGTDSLGFAMADRSELYDRNIMIHTSFIPFREYARLLDIHSVDTYIEYGGTLKIENMGPGDPDSRMEEVSFRDDESTRKYIDTAISRNIQHTLKNDRYGSNFHHLRELYEAGELSNVINRIVESMNHEFLVSVITERFKSHDLGSAKQLLLHDAPAARSHILYDINGEEVLQRLKAIIDIREREETSVEISGETLNQVKQYLVTLDLIRKMEIVYDDGTRGEYIIFTQPGMRYSIAKALVYSLMQDAYFNSMSREDTDYITAKILDDVKGRMLEDMIWLETDMACSRKDAVFKYRFLAGGEFDLVHFFGDTYRCKAYEVKHSTQAVPEKQARYLRNAEMTGALEKRYGPLEERCVIYRGPEQWINGIHYINAEEYLERLAPEKAY